MLPGSPQIDLKGKQKNGQRHITGLQDLPAALQEHEPLRKAFQALEGKFRFGITEHYLNLAGELSPDDPVLKQVLPSIEEIAPEEEIVSDPQEIEDPLQEDSHMPVPGLIHRYENRVLLLLSDRCAVYCRFCTRKRRVLDNRKETNPTEEDRATENQSSAKKDASNDTAQMISYIQEHPEIKEAILSGGEPLMRSDRYLQSLLRELYRIPHIVSVRIHTRMPVVQPSRFTDRLIEILTDQYPLTLVTHFNHPRELSPEAESIIRRLRKGGVQLLNQSVLLRGINDDFSTLCELIISLWKAGARPYYLHQCDPIPGTEHFHVPVSRGRQLIEELQQTLPGHIVPRYILDMPGTQGKVPLDGRSPGDRT